MNFEKYTDRAKGFVQSAQSMALREGHQGRETEIRRRAIPFGSGLAAKRTAAYAAIVNGDDHER